MAAFRAQVRPGARPGEVDTRRGRGRAICRCAAQPSMPPPLPHRDRTPRDVPSRARARAHALISCAAVRLARPERAGLRPGGAPRVPLEIAPLTASLSARVPRQVAPPRHARTVGALAPEAASGRDAARAHALAAPWPPALVPTHTPGPPRAARSVGARGVADRLSSIGRLGARLCARLNLPRSRPISVSGSTVRRGSRPFRCIRSLLHAQIGLRSYWQNPDLGPHCCPTGLLLSLILVIRVKVVLHCA